MGWIKNRSNGGKPHKGNLTAANRLMACVGGKSQLVHRLVALAFLPPPPDPSYTIDHIDRDPQNNAVDNLRWASRKEQNSNKNKRICRRDSMQIEVTAPDGTKTMYPNSTTAAAAIGTNYVNVCQAARNGWKVNGEYRAVYVAPEPQDIEGEIWKVSCADPTLRVSSLGRLQRKHQRGDGWGFKVTPAPTKDQQGYVHVKTQWSLRTPIHRLIMLTFIGPSEDPLKTSVDHVNHVRHDNRLSNLRWATSTEQNKNQARFCDVPGEGHAL